MSRTGWRRICISILLSLTAAFAAAPGAKAQNGEYSEQDGFYCWTDVANADPARMLESTLELTERSQGPDSLDLADAAGNLGRCYASKGREAEAEALLKRSLAIREKAFGLGEPGSEGSLRMLALFYAGQHREAEAKPLFERATAVSEKARAQSQAHALILLEARKRADVSTDGEAPKISTAADWKRKAKASEQALAFLEQKLGPNDPAVAEEVKTLSDIYQTLRRKAASEQMLKRYLSIREKQLGPEHPELANTLETLAWSAEMRGAKTEAQHYRSRLYAIQEKAETFALQVRENALGPDHPAVAETLQRLAGVYMRQGRYADAERLSKHNLAIIEKAFGADVIAVAYALEGLASVHAKQKQFNQAESLLKRAIIIQEKTLGVNHVDVRLARDRLAKLRVEPEPEDLPSSWFVALGFLASSSLMIWRIAQGPSLFERLFAVMGLVGFAGCIPFFISPGLYLSFPDTAQGLLILGMLAILQNKPARSWQWALFSVGLVCFFTAFMLVHIVADIEYLPWSYLPLLIGATQKRRMPVLLVFSVFSGICRCAPRPA